MTITERPQTALLAPGEPPPGSPEPWAFSRLAGPSAIVAGVLMVIAQLVWLPFDAKDYESSSTDHVFQAGSVLYLVGFCALLIAAVAGAVWQAQRAGHFSVPATVAVILGTTMLAGDLWFEAFVVPWIAGGVAPEMLDQDPSLLIGAGALASYGLFAIGWLVYGIASFRAAVVPKAIAVAIAVTGVIGFNALLSPFGIPLALAVAALGLWIVRSNGRA